MYSEILRCQQTFLKNVNDKLSQLGLAVQRGFLFSAGCLLHAITFKKIIFQRPLILMVTHELLMNNATMPPYL